jgi:glycosyltransferase involved in cell wall biosynthesis
MYALDLTTTITPPLRLVPGQPSPLSSVAIVIVAYNAEATIASVLSRVPASVASAVGAMLVSDDCSQDATATVALEWADEHPDVPVVVVRQAANLGYGGNQKYCYSWARAHGFDHAVMVHGDGQYAPELVLHMIEPLIDGRADVVFGSRMLTKGAALEGGMPRYKWVGNRILTTFQNLVSGLRLSEWHTGYRAYSLELIDRLDLESMSDKFDFDTEIILAIADEQASIAEIAIPTFYGNEKCHVNGLRYALDVVVDVTRHRSRRLLAAS